jgi:hypothetical protein
MKALSFDKFCAVPSKIAEINANDTRRSGYACKSVENVRWSKIAA